VGYFWDHAEQRHKIAHDYLIVNYVCPSGKHYALEFRRFRKREDCAAKRAELEAQPGGYTAASDEEKQQATFRTHTELCNAWWTRWWRKDPGTFTFDSYFTNAAVLNRIHGHGRAYVGDLKFNRKVWFRGVAQRADEMAAQIGPELRKKVTIGERTQWYFTGSRWLPQVNHKVRIVILWTTGTAKSRSRY